MGRRKARAGVAVEAGTENLQRILVWFGEAVLIGKYWVDSGLVGYLCQFKKYLLQIEH